MSKNVAILEREDVLPALSEWECAAQTLTAVQKRRLERALWHRARELVTHVNRAAEEEMLYLSECAGVWFLFGRPDKGSIDKLLLYGFCDVEDLSRLVIRLEDGMNQAGGATTRVEVRI